MNFLLTIKKIIVAGILGLIALTGPHQKIVETPVPTATAPTVAESSVTVGAFNPSGGGTYRLQSSIGTSNTTISLSSFKEPISNLPYTMAYLNTSVAYGTLDPQQPTLSEFISFTGITQNANGTAQLTGVTRGLSRSYPYTASSTVFAKAHSGQSIFILSNSPNFQAEYATKKNDETVSGLWSFTTSPYGSTPTSTNQLATKGYADGLAIAGAPDMSATTKGIGEKASGTEAASGAADGSGNTTAPLVLTSSIATSTCQVAQGTVLVASTTTGKLDKGCVDQTANYTLTGANTLSGTTTIAANTSKNLVLNNIQYVFPSATGTANQFLQNNGSGTLSWATSTPLLFSTTTPVSFNGNSTFTLFTTNIPGGTLSTNRVIHGKFNLNWSSVSTTGKSLNLVYGGSTCVGASATPDFNTTTLFVGVLDFWIVASGTGAQRCTLVWIAASGGGVFKTSTVSGMAFISSDGTTSVDSTANQSLSVTGSHNNGGTETISLSNGYIELIK